MNGRNRLAALVAAVEAAGYELNEALCRQLWQLYKDEDEQIVARSAPEYGEREYLLCVDAQGQPVRLPVAAVSDLSGEITRDPRFGLWFRPAVLPGVGELTLLPARWLCHLIGLRHQTVHLFIDHPTRPGHMLVQVRGVDKKDAPGCFDLPVAGHVEALDTLPATLDKEMGEELGLARDALDELTFLGCQVQEHAQNRAVVRNVEYQAVYRGRLSRTAWLDLCPASDEVAAVAVFPCSPLEAMMARFPERFALGLRDCWPLYMSSRSPDAPG